MLKRLTYLAAYVAVDETDEGREVLAKARLEANMKHMSLSPSDLSFLTDLDEEMGTVSLCFDVVRR